MKRSFDLSDDFYEVANKKSKTFCYSYALERATELSNSKNVADLIFFLNCLQESFLKVQIHCSIGKRSFIFYINNRIFSTVTSKEIYIYDNYDTEFYNFVKDISFILVDAVCENCDLLGLELIDDTENVISPSYYTAHFLASLAGYKLI